MPEHMVARTAIRIIRTAYWSWTLCIDNRYVIELMKDPVLHGRSKHIDVRFHFIKECIERGELIVKYVGTQVQRANILTKALRRVKFEAMTRLIGV